MILRFTDKLPKALYLDSSVILNATMTGGRFHDECASFLRRIRDEGIRCATASLSLDEIWYILIKNKIVCIVGLGYVGLPLAEAFARHLKVIGYDIEEKKIEKLNKTFLEKSFTNNFFASQKH